MAVTKYLYKDTATGVFLCDGNALSTGDYNLMFYSSDTIVSLVNVSNEETILDCIEITNLLKESGDPYTSKAELVTALTDLFNSGNGGSGTDPNAIHINAASEIHGLIEKITLHNDDEDVIEDSQATPTAYVKKRVKWSTRLSQWGDAILSVTGLKTFDKDKLALKGTSTGKTTLSTANASANDYIWTWPAKTDTAAGLTDLVNAGYDATIGTGGQYATILAAQTALGRDCILKAVGNIADPGALTTIGYRIIVNLNGYTMTFTNNRLAVTSGKYLEVYNGIITLDGNPGNIAFYCTNTQDMYMHDLTVNCAQTVDSCPFMYNGRAERVYGICSTGYYQTFLASANTYGFIGWAKNIILKVTNASATHCIDCNGYIEDITVLYGNVAMSTTGVIWLYSAAGGNPVIKRLTNLSGVAITVVGLLGTLEYATGTYITLKLGNGAISFTIKDSKLKGITKQAGTSGTLKLIGTSVVDAMDLTQPDRNIALDLDGKSSLTSNLSVNSYCNIEGSIGGALAVTGDYNEIKPGTRITGIVNVIGSYNNFLGAFLQAIITLLATAPGSTYNDISHCFLNASYLDSSGNATNTITNNRP
jgi:hypothetical protein